MWPTSMAKRLPDPQQQQLIFSGAIEEKITLYTVALVKFDEFHDFI